MKAVSVVIPCYNATKFLDKCIKQLVHQTIGIENMEIILVDDASTDNGATWNLISDYERQFPDTIIAVSLEQNMRQGGARNVGVSYASGEYIQFCDADDWLLEEALEHCYRAAKEYDADVVEFLNTDVDNHDIVVELVKGSRNEFIVLETEEQRKEFLLRMDGRLTLGSQRKFCRLSMVRENHLAFAEHLIFEEPSFMLPLRLYEKRHYFLDEVLYVNYLSQGSTVRGDWGVHKWDNPQVWMHLMDDLESRGLFKKYYSELEYLFMRWGLGLSIRMTLQKGYVITKQELLILIHMVLRMFPDVRKNKYLTKKKDLWDSLMLKLLDVEITDESVSVINDILYKYV
ncbi:MAG: glycosyltransferase family 2 protein [Lachnospiraceae bacterium]|nr:glycosyltransferase family 2 protein [Lachnospiraceae bacterium]